MCAAGFCAAYVTEIVLIHRYNKDYQYYYHYYNYYYLIPITEYVTEIVFIHRYYKDYQYYYYYHYYYYLIPITEYVSKIVFIHRNYKDYLYYYYYHNYYYLIPSTHHFYHFGIPLLRCISILQSVDRYAKATMSSMSNTCVCLILTLFLNGVRTVLQQQECNHFIFGIM